MDGKAKLKKLLRKQGYSVTQPRLAVFEFLQDSEEPVAVTEIAGKLSRFNKTSIYRTVELFESAGLIHRVWTGFKSKVELSGEFSTHHHHFTCLNCGRVMSLESDELERSLKKLETKNKFELTHHSVELSGYCNYCKTN